MRRRLARRRQVRSARPAADSAGKFEDGGSPGPDARSNGSQVTPPPAGPSLAIRPGAVGARRPPIRRSGAAASDASIRPGRPPLRSAVPAFASPKECTTGAIYEIGFAPCHPAEVSHGAPASRPLERTARRPLGVLPHGEQAHQPAAGRPNNPDEGHTGGLRATWIRRATRTKTCIPSPSPRRQLPLPQEPRHESNNEGCESRGHHSRRLGPTTSLHKRASEVTARPL